MTERYEDIAAKIIMADFKVEFLKLVNKFMEKYPPLEAISIPKFFVFIKKQDN